MTFSKAPQWRLSLPKIVETSHHRRRPCVFLSTYQRIDSIQVIRIIFDGTHTMLYGSFSWVNVLGALFRCAWVCMWQNTRAHIQTHSNLVTWRKSCGTYQLRDENCARAAAYAHATLVHEKRRRAERSRSRSRVGFRSVQSLLWPRVLRTRSTKTVRSDPRIGAHTKTRITFLTIIFVGLIGDCLPVEPEGACANVNTPTHSVNVRYLFGDSHCKLCMVISLVYTVHFGEKSATARNTAGILAHRNSVCVCVMYECRIVIITI